jgi:hypothetical protein
MTSETEPTYEMIAGSSPNEIIFLFFVDWLWLLIAEKQDVAQMSDGGCRQEMVLKNNRKVIAVYDPSTTRVHLESNLERATLEPILREAVSKAKAQDLGAPGWWKARFQTPAHDPHLHMIRSANQHRTFQGRWRLDGDALVEFKQKRSPEQAAFPPLYPDQEVEVMFRCRGPGNWGPQTARDAILMAAQIRAVLSYITASPLESASAMVPRLDLEEQRAVEAGLASDDVPELFVQDCQPWQSLRHFSSSGADETCERVLNAMLSFEQGMFQRTHEGVTVLFVTAIEALSVPNRGWASRRVTARFEHFLSNLAESTLREVVAHPNFKEIFGPVNTPRKLAGLLYSRRCKPAHTGNFGFLMHSIGPGTTFDPQMTVALIGQIAHAAILEFLKRPFSSLIGDPKIDKELKVDLTSKEIEELLKQAMDNGVTLNEWLRRQLGFGGS